MAASKLFGSIELLFIKIFVATIIFCVAYKPQSIVESINWNKEIEMSTKQIFSTNFEVFGKVQGVFFRKHTEKQAKLFGLRGWCMNTSQGTVRGQMEGELDKVNEMKNWLETKGSPKSRIDKAVFSETKEIPDYTFKAFTIKR
ncbi:acylphosphatase-2 isoform X2 [Bactrocera neohumeralis]|uniref:acylphosphatase-2 isoform X2 n=1 Tax=Bactrocera neohumeralis TaxID=98809 RepID=UPI0021653099|nr:acylphosphatase-2 isoform X2 [Bactrocera neohumeralis]